MLVFDPSQAVAGSVHLSEREYYGCPVPEPEPIVLLVAELVMDRGLAEVWLST